MARKTIKVEMPEGKPDEMIILTRNIVAGHNIDPIKSPLRGSRMDDFLVKQELAADKRREAKRLAEQSQALLGEAEQIMGTGPGQTRQSTGTLLNHLAFFRDQLLLHFKDNEGKMSEFGFKVTIGEAKTAVRKVKP